MLNTGRLAGKTRSDTSRNRWIDAAGRERDSPNRERGRLPAILTSEGMVVLQQRMKLPSSLHSLMHECRRRPRPWQSQLDWRSFPPNHRIRKSVSLQISRCDLLALFNSMFRWSRLISAHDDPQISQYKVHCLSPQSRHCSRSRHCTCKRSFAPHWLPYQRFLQKKCCVQLVHNSR